MKDIQIELEKMMTAEDAAGILGVHVKTVHGYIRDGKLIASKFGNVYRISRENLQKFIGVCETNISDFWLYASPDEVVSMFAAGDVFLVVDFDRATVELSNAIVGNYHGNISEYMDIGDGGNVFSIVKTPSRMGCEVDIDMAKKIVDFYNFVFGRYEICRVKKLYDDGAVLKENMWRVGAII